jgi:hypothetical protein
MKTKTTPMMKMAFGLLLAFSTGLVWGQQPNNGVRGDLLKIEDLPVLRTGIQTHQFCTYDRAGDNYDWDYFELYFEPNGEVVLFDAMGPGCLSRQQMNLWMNAGAYKTDTDDADVADDDLIYEPMPEAAAIGFSITGAVSTKILTSPPCVSAIQPASRLRRFFSTSW